jgi:hypothetical protein
MRVVRKTLRGHDPARTLPFYFMLFDHLLLAGLDLPSVLITAGIIVARH